MASDVRRSVRYAQNFLKSRTLARRLVRDAGIGAGDTVVEVGPGKGALTRELAACCHQVIAVEKDPVLAQRLRSEFARSGNVAIYEADFLDLPLPLTPYKVFASIPFRITSDIVTKLTGAANPPEEALLIMQREAAERFVGEPRETLVSLLLKPWFDTSIRHRFRRTDFTPPPNVDVVLVRFSKRGPPLVHPSSAQIYRDFVVYGFTAWKPSIRAAYRAIFGPHEFDRIAATLGFSPSRRPSEVGFRQWLGLFDYFRRRGTSPQRRVVAGAERRLRERQARLVKPHRTRV